MIKFFFIGLLLVFLFSSCRIFSKNVQGTYSRSGKDYRYQLILDDSSFTLTQKYFEVNSACTGKWKYLAKDTILLMCDEGDLSEKIQAGYMAERKNKIIVLNKNKLKLREVILKRKNR